jgi:alpha-L-rhamnosidase/acyl-CoA thioesterase-1
MWRVCLIIAVVALAQRAWATSALVERLTAGQHQTVVVYGTSLTAGGAWVTQLSTSLEAQFPGQVTWVNAGMSGKASNSGVANLANVLQANPDAVFLEFAMNDAFTAYPVGDIDYGISPAQSQANLNTMIDAIVAHNADCEILLQTMNPAWDAGNGNQSGSKRPNLATYFQGYREVAAHRELAIIDNHTIWTKLQANQPSSFQGYVSDGVHPNAAGYSHLVTPAIRHVLGADNGLALLVDPVTGRAVLQNQTREEIELVGYTVSSPGAALLGSGHSLASRGLANWFEANSNSQHISELNPLEELVLTPGAGIDFGTIWNTAGTLDLKLVYQTTESADNVGSVVYTSLLPKVGEPGDFNADGRVDGRDFLRWQRDFGASLPQFTGADGNGDYVVDGADLALWQQYYGGAGAVVTSAVFVAEPSGYVFAAK